MTSLATTAPTTAARRERPRALRLWLLPLALLGALIASLLLRPRMAPAHDGSAADRAFIGRAIRGEEPGFRREALKKFAGDTWSQGDDFGQRERTFVERHAKLLDMRPGAVLEAIDHDVRTFPDALPGQRRGEVAPCMPRPFYQ